MALRILERDRGHHVRAMGPRTDRSNHGFQPDGLLDIRCRCTVCCLDSSFPFPADQRRFSFYCRYWVVGKLKAYDFIMLAALLCTWGLCVINHYQLLYGTGGQDDPNAPKPELTPEFLALFNKIAVGGAKAWFSYRIMYLVCLGLIKLSILVFYLTFATSRAFKNLVVSSIVVIVVFTMVTGFLNGFECPHDPSLTLSAKIYDNRYTSRCLNRPILYYTQAGFNIFSDAFILFLPMPSLWQLRMQPLKRASLFAVFSVGLLVPIASGIRVWSLYYWAHSGTRVRYTGAYMIFWSQVEINTAIVCASAPSFQPLFKRVFGRLVSYRTHSAYYYYGDGANTQTMTQFRLQPGSGRITEEDCISDAQTPATPASSHQPNKRSTGGTFVDADLIVIKELDEEEEIRERVRRFASNSSLRTTPPISPQRPRDTFSPG